MSQAEQSTLRYALHGCVIDSSFVIPDLAPCVDPNSYSFAVSASRTNHFWRGDKSTFSPWRPDDVVPLDREVRMQYLKGADGYLIRFEGFADFLIGPAGSTIVVYMENNELPQFIRDILVGPILATALLIQGAYALHGSCVTRNGSAMAFIGNNGAGKSTLAASYVADGWELLTDGMFVATLADGQAWVHPGDPRIRVRPDAAGKLTYLPRLDTGNTEGVAKYRLAIGDDGWGNFSRAAQPLRVAYILEPSGPDEGVVIEPCTGADAIMTALANTYGVQTYQSEFLVPHLKYVGQFLKLVPLRRLKYIKELENLSRMLQAVTADADQFLR
ncbi:MAG: hypothetical protein HZB26_14070 [Candidatus Hydrogenedentes bacterium]|nr:hypothetical protein [Candidatus Hydrogenedentota bacterium]